MITIIFAPPRTGKTCFLTYLANEYAFDKERNKLMKNDVITKNNSGFNLTIPNHCVSSNYDIILRKFGYSPRYSRRINPFKLGFNNDFVNTHYNYPFEAIFITEAQKYFNSRMSMYYPDWQSRWFEQHGHNNLDIFLDTQRPMLIDVNIRELAQFIEIINLKIYYNEFGKVKKMKWTIRKIENSSLFDKYMSSGKKDKSCYQEETVIANYNVFSLYSSQSCKPKFYDGHFEEDFDINLSSNIYCNSKEEFIEFLKNFDDELPDNFYQTKRLKKD